MKLGNIILSEAETQKVSRSATGNKEEPGLALWFQQGFSFFPAWSKAAELSTMRLWF